MVVVEILDVEVVTVVDFCTNVDVVSVVDFCLNVVVAKSPVKIQCFLIVEYETSEDFEWYKSSDSFRISLVLFRTFRGPLFSEPITGQELFFAVSLQQTGSNFSYNNCKTNWAVFA